MTPYKRTAKPGHCKEGGASYVKERGFFTNEVVTIDKQLSVYAFKSAAYQASGKCWPKLWGVGECKKSRNSACCSGKCKVFPKALPPFVGECE